jgi:hypothetical protein
MFKNLFYLIYIGDVNFLNSKDCFIDKCYKELEIKQNELSSKYKINTYKNYFIDQHFSSINFNNRLDLNDCNIGFEIVFLGYRDKENNIWKWSWNESNIYANNENYLFLKRIMSNNDINLTRFSELKCNENLAYELTAIGVHLLNALAMYKVPKSNFDLFVAIMKEKKVCYH